MTDMSGPFNWGAQTIRYRFQIRTLRGLAIDRLVIHGRDQADAERKLRQMYPRCEVQSCVVLEDAPPHAGAGRRPTAGNRIL